MLTIAFMVLAQASTAAPATAVPAKAQVPTAKVECRIVQEAGSRIPTKICRLDKEWELMAKDVQDDIRSSRNSRGVAINPE